MSGHSQPNSHDRSLTQQVAAACAGFTYHHLPATVQARSRLILLDTLGAMLAAAEPSYPGTARLAHFVEAEAASGCCTVAGTSLRTSLTNAALMNGYLAYALDVESHHGPAIVHAAAAVVPAALALAQQESSTGAELLAAVVLGIDVACRVSHAIGPNDMYNRGFHPTSLAGTFGATAAGALLLRQSVEQIERAMGLAATQAGGLLAWASDETEESRPFNPGLAARNGVTAAQLATLGFGAPGGIFDSRAKYNVFRAWSEDGIGTPERLLDGFGETFAIDELTIKQYACCAFLHPALDGLFDILRSESIDASRVTGITVRFPKTGSPIIDNNPLRSHRAQYILPVAAVRGAVLFDDVINDRSSEAEVQRLSGVTTFVQDEELDRYYPERYTTEITVTTRDQARHARLIHWASGTPENPLADAMIVEKFRQLAAARIDAQQTGRVVSLVEGLDQADSIEELMTALTVAGSGVHSEQMIHTDVPGG
jgi:2-methylcitrate dehydratase PrpD